MDIDQKSVVWYAEVVRKTDLVEDSHSAVEQRRIQKSQRNLFAGLVIVVVLLAGTVSINLLLKNQQTLRQEAAPPGNPTATININPSSGSLVVGQPLTVNLVIDGGGQAFNAAKADIEVSPNLTIQAVDIVPAGSGGCNFTFINSNKTPKVSDLSFTGAILNGSSTSCTLFTATIVAASAGIGTINITRPSVKAYSNSSEILLSVQNGQYATGTSPTVTATPTPTPVPTNTPTPTSTPTPTPTAAPTPTPVVVPPPTVDALVSQTYLNSILITGTRDPQVTEVFVNSSQTGVVLPSSTTWQYPATLVFGVNNFTIFGRDAGGNSSTSVGISIDMHKLADINGDSLVDLTDLSMFATDWENTGILNHILSDMNQDNVIDLEDFSVLARQYGN